MALEYGPLSNYASVSANINLKPRLRARFSYICCIFLHEASISSYCLREMKRNSKVVYYHTVCRQSSKLLVRVT